MDTLYSEVTLHSGVIDAIHKTKHNNIMDSENVLRCRGRLENAKLTEGAKMPILIPKKDSYTQMLIERTQRNLFHDGVSQTRSLVRQKYWIPHGRTAMKAVLLKCSICRHYEGGPYKMPTMPPLPTKRGFSIYAIFTQWC